MGIKRIGYGDKYKALGYSEYICDTESDLDLLPTNKSSKVVDGSVLPKCSAGSRAIVVESKKVYVLNTDGVWSEFIDHSGAGGGSGAVTSVNGKTGAVSLTASDVHALPDSTVIPAAVTEQDVAGWGFTKNTGTYSKPTSGIPASDLAAGVIPTVPTADISANTAARHTHDNKALLDTYTQTESNLADAVSKKHDHSNKTVLDGIDATKVAAWDAKGTYSKPSGGIPASDLASDVQTSLGKADTALQSHQSLAAYRTSGAQDTIDAAQDTAIAAKYTKPSGGIPASDLADGVIPAAVTEQDVAGWGFTKNTGTYSKPSGGIPASDLASTVQTSLGKADTALQQHQDVSGKANTSDLARVAFSGDYNDLLNRPDDGYIFADEIPQDADRSAKYVLPDGYIYVYGEHTYHRVYNAATDGLLNKVPGLNQNVNYSDDQPGAFLSAPIPWDSSWTQWEKTPTIIRVSGLDQLVPVKWNNAIQIWYYKSDGSHKKMISQQSIHSLGSPAAGESIDLPCEFNMADNNYYPLEGTGYVRVWLGISADGAITADDVANLVINVPFYDEDVTATEWYNSGERYISDPQVQQNTEDIADLDTRVTALEEDSGSGGDISVSTNQVLYAVGDSITRGAAAGGEDYAWPKHVIDINGYDATNSVNLGQNGLGFDTAATSSGDTVKTIVDRTDFSVADIVTVALGCNDWSNSNARLDNVWANMEYCFNKIRTDNPYCKLFYILPFNMSFGGTFNTFYCLSFKGDSNKLCPYAYTLMEYINMIKDKLSTPTFQAFRINVIDMVECAAINRQNITTALADQVHPTAATQAELGKEIARRIVLADGAGGVLPIYAGGVS